MDVNTKFAQAKQTLADNQSKINSYKSQLDGLVKNPVRNAGKIVDIKLKLTAEQAKNAALKIAYSNALRAMEAAKSASDAIAQGKDKIEENTKKAKEKLRGAVDKIADPLEEKFKDFSELLPYYGAIKGLAERRGITEVLKKPWFIVAPALVKVAVLSFLIAKKEGIVKGGNI